MTKPVAIVTGASRGIGKEVALMLLSKNYCVSVVSDDKEALFEVFKSFSKDSVLILYGNLEDMDFARQVIDDTYKKWNKINALINNAAWRAIETLRTMSFDNWEKTLRVCLTTPAFLSKWASHYMEKDGVEGVIINISSVMANRPGGTAAAYVACKGALLSLTYEMAALLGPSKIRVVAVIPGKN
jgi:NAD(P)-dependent dehydrogenase (short-subunit alcohol dehydrogenase family)